MTATRPTKVIPYSARHRSIAFHGNGGAIRSAAKSLGVPVMASAKERDVTLVPDWGAADVMAWCEGRGKRFEQLDGALW